MHYPLSMNLGGSSVWRTVRLAALGAACLSAAPWLSAGEAIRFSGRAGAPSPQEFDRREPLLPSEARSGGKSLARPDFPMESLLPVPAMTPTTGLTRKQAETLDQKRNWIYQSPDAILKQGAKTDGDTKTRTERNEDDQPKSAAERFLEDGDSKAGKADKLNNNDPVQKQLRDRREAEERNERNHSSRNPQDKDTAGRTKGEENTTGFETRTGSGARGPDERYLFNMGDARSSSLLSEARDRERQRERDASIESFKRSFNNPWAQNAPSGGGSLLAPGLSGGTPATTMGLPGAEMRRPLGLGGSGGRAATDFAPRGGLGGFDAGNAANYGVPESALRQNEPPRAAPRPIVLEAPKRKF